MAELGSTSAQLGALQSLAAAPAAITLPQVQHTAPPQASTSDELVASMAGGNDNE